MGKALSRNTTATKQRWQPASQVVRVKDLLAVEARDLRPNNPTQERGMNNDQHQNETFTSRLQRLQTDLAVIIQCAEVSVLVNSFRYHQGASLPAALHAITCAIDVWRDCQHEYKNLRPNNPNQLEE